MGVKKERHIAPGEAKFLHLLSTDYGTDYKVDVYLCALFIFSLHYFCVCQLSVTLAKMRCCHIEKKDQVSWCLITYSVVASCISQKPMP